MELEQQVAVAEEYNDNLHEEVHLLHNQLHPVVVLFDSGASHSFVSSTFASKH